MGGNMFRDYITQSAQWQEVPGEQEVRWHPTVHSCPGRMDCAVDLCGMLKNWRLPCWSSFYQDSEAHPFPFQRNQ